MGDIESGDRSLPRIPNGSWHEPISNSSGYWAWQVIWSVFSFLLFGAGILQIRWGLEDIEAREATLALGFGLATWGIVLILVTGITVWLKSTSVPVDQRV